MEGGGFAREVAWLVQSCNERAGIYELACFIDDNTALHGTELNGIPVMRDCAHDRFPSASVLGGTGNPHRPESA